ncbi:RICIN domain-containing protein [Streptomyces sp. CRPSP2-6A1]|uniref:RICIN domain-containing protein n=1 Tax=Streptomyces sp. CRPSP2-6A1 TaxID=2799588 RepID=UPI0018F07A56|nr:RICIN domain-containing protein [Streptomyces sp. CRPSP2-6A1]MBJ7002140.1 RICIN domain-containing protein [Streptomyces sp. CRPSP2-6A1]
MRKAAGSLLLTAVAAGTMTGLAAPSADAAPQAKDPYAHVRLERVWAAHTCLSMGGSTKQNAQLTVGKCSSDKSQRWTLHRIYKNDSLFTIKNDKSGKCLNVDKKSHIVQYTCHSTWKAQRWGLGGSLLWSEAHNGKVIASNSTKAGSHPYLEKAGSSNPARGRQEWGLS